VTQTGDRPIVIKGGRVLDPPSGRDEVVDVYIADGKIAQIGGEVPQDVPVIDAAGLVVSPGFIDIHSHAQTRLGLELQALDGVTTALDLECGALPVRDYYHLATEETRPINFGYSASWAVARMHVMAELPLPTAEAGQLPLSVEVFQRNQHLKRWHDVASRTEVAAIIRLLEKQLEDGAVGVGILLGYAPGSGREELLQVARLAQAAEVGIFVHGRHMSNEEPQSSVDTVLELIGVGAATGAQVHICHLNSTSLRRVDDAALAIASAQRLGVRLTTEAYPYTYFSTGMGAPFLARSNQERLGITAQNITYLPLGRRVENNEELEHLRNVDPGGLCLVDYLDPDEAGDLDLLMKSLTLEGGVIASDAMPLVDTTGAYVYDDRPLVQTRTHPRSVGTFARTFGWLVRERNALTLLGAVERTSTRPAKMLAESVPAMRTKGRISVGFDADITIFDPQTISDRANGMTPLPSTGIVDVIVNGNSVVHKGRLVPGSSAGIAIRT
jgi:N-acyl-D-aspartate/D-glutamate deacylase